MPAAAGRGVKRKRTWEAAAAPRRAVTRRWSVRIDGKKREGAYEMQSTGLCTSAPTAAASRARTFLLLSSCRRGWLVVGACKQEEVDD